VTERLVPLAALAVCAVVGLSACGTTAPRREYTAADQGLAARVALRSADLPPDWRTDPTTDASPKKCYDPILSHLVITGEAASEFSEGPKGFSRFPNYASSYVLVFVSHGTAASALIRLRKTKALRCLATDFERHLPDRESSTRVSIRRLRPPRFGEQSSAAEIAIDFGKNSFTPRGYVGVVLVHRGRVFALMLFGDIGNPFDPVVERQLARAVAARMPSN